MAKKIIFFLFFLLKKNEACMINLSARAKKIRLFSHLHKNITYNKLINNMQNLFLGLAARKKKVSISTGKNPLGIAITKQKKQHNEVINTKFPPASKEWVNSVYSFNPNYIKPLAMVDIMVNRLIKSYFNFVKLIWKRKYKFNTIALKKKLKLIKRRKKAEIKKNKLSLNRVFVSRGEMKHTNNKVIATFYVFNKTKKFLLYKLNNLYKTFSLSSGQSPLNNSKQANTGFISLLEKKRAGKTLVLKNDISTYINKKRSKTTKQSYSNPKALQLSGLKKQNNSNAVNVKHKNLNMPYLNSAEKQNQNLYNHIYLANLTKKRISRFIYKINNTDIKNKYITLMKNLYSGISKYKLYSGQNPLNNYKDKTLLSENIMYNVNTLNVSSNLFSRDNAGFYCSSVFYRLLNRNHNLNLSRFTKYFDKVQNTPINISTKSSIIDKISILSLGPRPEKRGLRKTNNNNMVHILKTFYKSFVLYNTNNTVNDTNNSISTTLYNDNTDIALQNTKLSISKVKNSMGPWPENSVNKQSYLFDIAWSEKKYKHKTSSPVDSLVEKKTNKMKTMVLKTIKLINKIRRYKKFIIKSLNLELNTIDNSNINKRFIAYEKSCIKNFLRKTYRKEWLYIRYVKMLLFNNNKYRSSFLLGLKNVVSKLYNKKVEFNFVNLKYLYLNSDILSKSIAMRLRNRRNRLLTVLNKAVLLVNIPSINNKWEFTPSLAKPFGKTKILKDNNNISSFASHTHNNNDSLNLLLGKLYLADKPCSIESNNLTTTQKNALQLVNNKAVFGVRLEAAGRLTKRLTASRSVSKLKYRGSIKNISSSNYGLSSVILKGNLRSNLQYTKISSKTRNGSFGLKGWVSAY